MKRVGLLIAFLAVCGAAWAQQTPKNPRLANELSNLVLQHLTDRKTLRQDADRLAVRFKRQLSQVGPTMKRLELEASRKFGETDWQQKGALVMELWRIRSSIDLLALLSPGVFKEVTGYDIPSLQLWTDGLKDLENKVKSPFFGL